MPTQKSIFESKTCGRCGGTGHYSYNQVSGTTCFGCNGKGFKLTPRGSAALNWLLDQRRVRALDVKPGDLVYHSGSRFRVTAAGWDQTGSRWLDKATGEWRPYYTLSSANCAYCLCTGEEQVVVIPSAHVHKQQIAAALEYQNSLSKNGKPRKRAAA